MKSIDDEPKKILLVEDEDAIRLELRELLEEEGYVVEEATNGKEAIAAIQHSLPALVLLDLMMPEMDGWQFLHALSQIAADVPVVLTTAADANDIPSSIPRVHKPYAVEPLLNLVERGCH